MIKLELVVLGWVPKLNNWRFVERLEYTTDDKKKANTKINRIKKVWHD